MTLTSSVSLESHLCELITALSADGPSKNRETLWRRVRLPDLDPHGEMKAARVPRLVLIDENDMTCPVCLQLFKSGDNLRQCINGHTFCPACCPASLQPCPTCKVKGPYSRSLMKESFSRMLLTECADCKKTLSPQERSSHTWICPKTVVACPFCSANCSLEKLGAHFEETHGDTRASRPSWILHVGSELSGGFLWTNLSQPWSLSHRCGSNKDQLLVWVESFEVRMTGEISIVAYVLLDPTKRDDRSNNTTHCKISIEIKTSNQLQKLFDATFEMITLPNWWSEDREKTKVVNLPIDVFKVCETLDVSPSDVNIHIAFRFN